MDGTTPVNVSMCQCLITQTCFFCFFRLFFPPRDAEVAVSYAGMPEDYPTKWLTFCAEGTVEEVEAFIGSKDGKPLVPLLSLRGVLQVGYPQFMQMISS